MEEKKCDVKIYCTGFCVYEVSANNEIESILKTRTLPISQNEMLSILDNWEDADIAAEMKDEERII